MTGEPHFEAAFREEFATRFAPLYRYLNRLTGDPDLAADIAQEAFVRLYQRGEMPADPKLWLVSVAHNLFRDERRRTTRRGRLLLRYTPEQDSNRPEPDDALIRSEARSTARAALDRLAQRERMLLLLRHEGYSYQEIAAAIGVAPSSVGTLLARAVAAFRRAYEGGGHAPD